MHGCPCAGTIQGAGMWQKGWTEDAAQSGVRQGFRKRQLDMQEFIALPKMGLGR